MAIKKKRKKAKKVGINAKSRVTKKKPSTRLKKRRKANVKKGYYPNPVTKQTFYVAFVVNNGVKYYYHGYVPSKGLVFKDQLEDALWYRKPKKAVDEVTYLIEKSSTKSVARNAGKVKAEIYRPK
jgi:hypothetical protein